MGLSNLCIVTDRTFGGLGVITSAPHGATQTHQELQHATSTHGAPQGALYGHQPARTQEAARKAICSVLGLHHVIHPGPSLGLQETSTTDMARESPILGACQVASELSYRARMAPKKGDNATAKAAAAEAAAAKVAVVVTEDQPCEITLEKKVSDLQTIAKDVVERLDVVDDRLDELENKGDRVQEDVQGLLETMEKMDERSDGLESMMSLLEARLMDKIGDLESELNIYKAALKNGVRASTETGTVEPRIDVPKPGRYDGTKTAQAVENYFWGMEQCSEAKDKDLPVGTWAEFQKELKERFYPKDAEREARSKLRQLRHDKSIPEYVKKFTEIKFQIPTMGEEEGFALFMDGLQRWACIELERRGVKDLSSAIETAESIAKHEKRSDSTKPKPKHKGNGAEDKEKQGKNNNEKNRHPQSRKPGEKKREYLRCYTCGGNHYQSNCPQFWKGLPDSEGSWELAEDLWQFKQQVSGFHSSQATRASLDPVGENVTDRTFGGLGVITSAPHGATQTHQELQHATSTHGAPQGALYGHQPARTQEAARKAICSVLGLHHVIHPGPSLGLQETSTTDMARESPSQL
ncbi:hypothetical protein GQ457_18G014350 [Hibiscus cannabinus]